MPQCRVNPFSPYYDDFRGGGVEIFFCIFCNFSSVFYDSIPNICHYSELFQRLFAPSHVTHLPWGGVVVPPQVLQRRGCGSGSRRASGPPPGPARLASAALPANLSGTPGPRPPLPARPLRLALRAAWPPRRSGCACPFGAPPALLRRLAWPIGAGALRLAPAGAPPGGARPGLRAGVLALLGSARARCAPGAVRPFGPLFPAPAPGAWGLGIARPAGRAALFMAASSSS